MLEDFIIARIKAELPFTSNEEKEGLFTALGTFIVSREARKAFILRGYADSVIREMHHCLIRKILR